MAQTNAQSVNFVFKEPFKYGHSVRYGRIWVPIVDRINWGLLRNKKMQDICTENGYTVNEIKHEVRGNAQHGFREKT